jgi:hypothetical protein
MKKNSGKALSIDFVYKHKRGRVDVYFSVNKGVKSSGFVVIGHEITDQMIRDYPVMRVEVGYSGRGYEALMGWVQLVTHRYPGGKETDEEIDIPAELRDYQIPYCC